MIFAANFTWDAVSQLTVTGDHQRRGLRAARRRLRVDPRRHRPLPLRVRFTYALAAYAVFWCSRSGGLPCWPAAVLRHRSRL